uniref:DUF6598 domain-containing protein n=1 Tax=Oryza rufipogon TaxID=4529 RepID=A0A0E0RI91_ORYRU
MRPRDGSEEEELLNELSHYRRYWTNLWSDDSGDIAKRSILRWPIDVFGLISVRDSLDRNHNYIFERTRNNCQTLTAKLNMKNTSKLLLPCACFTSKTSNKLTHGLYNNVEYITPHHQLTGDGCRHAMRRLRLAAQDLVRSCAARALDQPGLSSLLRRLSHRPPSPVRWLVADNAGVKGTSPSEDKILSAKAFGYNGTAQRHRCGSLRSMMLSGARSKLEFKYAHIPVALEATIKVRITGGSTDFCGKFIAHTASINEHVILLDSGEEMVAFSHDGAIHFCRSVVAVEGNGGALIVDVHARQSGDENISCASKKFIPVRCGWSRDTLDVGFCRMSVEVSWSLMFSY